MMNRQTRRNKIVSEIIHTEETYVKHLNLILKYFQEPLLESDLLPRHVISLIFGNLQQLVGVNEELLSELRDRTIGEAFLSVAPYFKLYASYARGHEHALKTLMEWEQKNAKFSEFRRSQEMYTELSGLKLNALLITPVQRIPRYKLLLEELLNNMESSDEDYENIRSACDQIGNTASYINTHIKNYDNTQRMVEIQKRLGGDKKLNIMEPGRVFMREGILHKVCARGNRSQERMLFLFSDMFMYAKVDSSGGYTACNILPLHKCEVSSVLSNHTRDITEKSQGGMFRICCLETQFLFYSQNRKEVGDWLDALNSAISVYRQDRRSLRKESSGKRPARAKQLASKYKRKAVHHSSPLNNNNNNSPSSPGKENSGERKSVKKRSIYTVFSCTPVLQKKRRTSIL